MVDFTNVQSQTTGEQIGISINGNCFFSLGFDVLPVSFSNSFLIDCIGNKSPSSWSQRVPTLYSVVLTLGTTRTISSLLVEFSVEAMVVHHLYQVYAPPVPIRGRTLAKSVKPWHFVVSRHLSYKRSECDTT